MNRASCLEKRYRRGEPGLLRAHAEALSERWGIHPEVAYDVATWLAWNWGATPGLPPMHRTSAYARALAWNAETRQWQVAP